MVLARLTMITATIITRTHTSLNPTINLPQATRQFKASPIRLLTDSPNFPPNNLRMTRSSMSPKISLTRLITLSARKSSHKSNHTSAINTSATIIKKTSSRQDEIALYLIERIADYDNVDLVVKSLTFKSGREKVINAAISFITSHPNDPRFAPKNVNNISSKIDFTFGSEVMPQLRLYLRYNLIYSDDAAQIVRKTSSHQGEVGQYLATRLADPNNINILIDAVTFRSDKDAIIKAALNAQQ